jgi:HK97 family phage major capsid protein
MNASRALSEERIRRLLARSATDPRLAERLRALEQLGGLLGGPEADGPENLYGGRYSKVIHYGPGGDHRVYEAGPRGVLQVMNRARFGLPALQPALPDDEEPPGAALDKHPWASNWAAFFNALRDERDGQGARTAIRNAWTERRGSDGGFLIPERLRQEVLFYLAGSIIRPRAMVIPAETLRTGLPSLDNPDQSNGQQGLGGIEFSLVTDGEAIPATAGRFSRVILEAKKIAALLEDIPNELLEDASEAMGDLLGRIIGLGYGWFVDDLAINGNGAGEPEGLMFCPAAYAVSRATPSEVLHADVVAMAKRLHPASKKTATWLASEDVFDWLLELYEIVGTAPAGQDIPPPQTLKFNSARGQWELMGLPLEVSDHQPQIGTAGDLMLADLSLYVFAERQAMEVELSSRGASFASGTTSARVKGRIDGRFWPRSVYTLRNGRQCSPLVVLQ